jgi:hypothetical protein
MRILACAIAVLVLAACGTVTTGGGATPPAPTPITTPPAGFDVLVTEHDRAIGVHVGQKILVYLTQHTGMTQWEGVRADDPTVLGPSPINFMAPRGVTVGGFVALAPGTTQVTSTAGPLCSPGQACPMYAMLFSVTVTVT